MTPCERDSCGHDVAEHNRKGGSMCSRCPCRMAIVDGAEAMARAKAEPGTRQYTLRSERKEETRTSGEGTTIRYLRDRFFEAAETPEGTTCVVCDRFGKVYTRRLNGTMIVALIRLYHLSAAAPEREWFHFTEFTDTRNEYEKLKFWNLIDHKPNDDDPTKRDSGYWKITPEGIQFATMKMLLPEKVVVYDGTVRGYKGSNISIREALGEKFNYSKLMSEGGVV